MEFRIADTFTDSLARLAADEQKTVKTTAFDLQVNPAHPSLQFHKLEKAKDPRFWSVRVNRDVRIIVHRDDQSLLLCYVHHHDEAYHWAERRRLETHPKTGAAQIVEIREVTQDVVVPRYVDSPRLAPAKPPLFRNLSDDDLLGYGVPADWIASLRGATEDTVLDIADHLPAEAAEAVLALATGGKPFPSQPAAPGTDPFTHPDAQRRFRVMNDLDELARALDYPWEKWIVFLHPAQRSLVERDYAGPARVAGSAGTGKTIVALHRARYLAHKHPEARILLTTLSDPLARALEAKLRRLIANEPRLAERIEVQSLDAVARRLYSAAYGPPVIANRADVRLLLGNPPANFSSGFLLSEWEQVVDAWGVETWESYRDVPRLGRRTRLPEAKRRLLWETFEKLRSELAARGLTTTPAVSTRVAQRYASGEQEPPFDFVVIDEAQDVSIAQLRLLAAMNANRPNGLFFAGDLGQRIFQQPFSWKALGVDVRGRSSTLKINYRTSHQIRTQADRLLGPEISDVDGIREDRRGTISVFNGPPPEIQTFADEAAEAEAVGQWLRQAIQTGARPPEIGVFVRSLDQLDRAKSAVAAAGQSWQVLDESPDHQANRVAIGTMHLAKGLEFKSVVIMAADDEVIPLQQRIESVTDEAELEEVYNTERHLLYVALTRARDHLLVTSTDPHSEFLDDLRS
jgi:mRNA-degrading endonuclease RelE of RelBE toxin-antitoxin system